MVTAPARRRPAPDIDLYKACKSRITDYYTHNADSIRTKRTVTAAACIFDEMRLLCREVRKQDGVDLLDEPDRFVRIERYVARICEDYADNITSGGFVKISASVFSVYRFLTRAVESVLKRLLDVEEQFALGDYIPDKHTERIELDLDAGLAEDKPILADEPARDDESPVRTRKLAYDVPVADDDDNLPP